MPGRPDQQLALYNQLQPLKHAFELLTEIQQDVDNHTCLL